MLMTRRKVFARAFHTLTSTQTHNHTLILFSGHILCFYACVRARVRVTVYLVFAFALCMH